MNELLSREWQFVGIQVRGSSGDYGWKDCTNSISFSNLPSSLQGISSHYQKFHEYAQDEEFLYKKLLPDWDNYK